MKCLCCRLLMQTPAFCACKQLSQEARQGLQSRPRGCRLATARVVPGQGPAGRSGTAGGRGLGARRRPCCDLEPAGKALRPAAAPVHPGPPAAASAAAARSPSRPAARKRGRAGDPRREPRTLRPAAAPPRKGGAAHRSPGMRLQGAARRRPPAEAAPRARSTRAAILSGASAPTAKGAADAAAAAATPPPAARASRLVRCGAGRRR